jgi:hypothetical protein
MADQAGRPADWEMAKENIQPLKQGRKMAKLANCLQVRFPRSRVADPHHFYPDPYPPFHFNADPDPMFNFHPDPRSSDPDPHQSDGNLRPLVYLQYKPLHGSVLILRASIVNFHGPPWLLF